MFEIEALEGHLQNVSVLAYLIVFAGGYSQTLRRVCILMIPITVGYIGGRVFPDSALEVRILMLRRIIYGRCL